MRIVIVEDNVNLAKAISYCLRNIGHSTDLLHDGDEADAFVDREGADIIILDINLPGKSGLEILKDLRLRGDGTPVILLSARSETKDRVIGLDMGADDYLIKPFEMDELEARIRALSRRKNLDYSSFETIGQIKFDRSTRHIAARGETLELPRRELSTFECLLERKGRIVSKGELTDHVYGIGADIDDKAVEPHVSRLRRRLSDYGVTIKSARGLGYMLVSS